MNPTRLASCLRSVADYVDSNNTPSKTSVLTAIKLAVESTTSQCVAELAAAGDAMDSTFETLETTLNQAQAAFEDGNYTNCCSILDQMSKSISDISRKMLDNSKIFS